MSVLNNTIAMGAETSYGSQATPTQPYEATGDDWQTVTEQISNDGFRRVRDAILSSRVRTVVQGATGSIPHAFLTEGELLALQAAFPTVGARTSNAYTCSTKGDGSNPRSYTVQVNRSTGSGTQAFTYVGCVVTSWEFSIEIGGALMFTPTFDGGRAGVTNIAYTDPTSLYEEGSVPYYWNDIKLQIDNTDVAYLNSFSLSADLGYNTDRRFLHNTHVKSQPIRSSTPEYTGEISGEFINTDEYANYHAGTLVSLKLVGFSSREVSTGVDSKIEIELPKVLYTGGTVTASLSDLTSITLPFMALADDETTAASQATAVKVTYTTKEGASNVDEPAPKPKKAKTS